MKDYLSSFNIDRRENAYLTVFLSIYLFVNSVNTFIDGNLTWTAYALSIILLVFIPPLKTRKFTDMVPFEILLYLAIPFTLKGMEMGFIASHTLNYLAAAGVALLIVAELEKYTSFRTKPRFTVWLVSLTTIAVAGFWAVARWVSHLYFGTGFSVTGNGILMWEFAAAGLAGMISGKIFSVYFRRIDRRLGTK